MQVQQRRSNSRIREDSASALKSPTKMTVSRVCAWLAMTRKMLIAVAEPVHPPLELTSAAERAARAGALGDEATLCCPGGVAHGHVYKTVGGGDCKRRPRSVRYHVSERSTQHRPTKCPGRAAGGPTTCPHKATRQIAPRRPSRWAWAIQKRWANARALLPRLVSVRVADTSRECFPHLAELGNKFGAKSNTVGRTCAKFSTNRLMSGHMLSRSARLGKQNLPLLLKRTEIPFGHDFRAACRQSCSSRARAAGCKSVVCFRVCFEGHPLRARLVFYVSGIVSGRPATSQD